MAAGGSRYETLLKLASGGMATVWVGNARGALGFRQLVAIKKPHPHLLDDPAFRSELVAEARLASMIRHANVVDVRDVEVEGDSISLVMDYIEGASLGDLLVAAGRRGQRIPPRVVVRIILDALAGLHAAHELVDERDRPIGLVHRDVSPQNILVGTDGTSRVADFGVAKFARKNMQSTSEGSLKGKLAYMPPEYLRGEAIDRRFDVFATGVVLWEALCGKRLFRGENEPETLRKILEDPAPPVSTVVPEVAALDEVVLHALAKDRNQRFQNAAAMAAALESAASSARLLGSHVEVGAALKDLVGDAIAQRRELVRSKLANEPSVASLVHVPPIVVAAAEMPPTQAAATPKMADAPPTQIAPTAAIPMTTGVPTTQPMISDTVRDLPPAAVGTLASAPPLGSPRTLASASPITPGTLRSDAPPPQVQQLPPMPEPHFHEASGRSFTGEVPTPPVTPTPRWVLPAVLAVAAGLVAIVVFVLLPLRNAGDAKKEAPAATTATVTATASAPAPAVSSAPAIATSAPIAIASASAAPAPRASAKPVVPRATTPSTASGHAPPPNPYLQGGGVQDFH